MDGLSNAETINIDDATATFIGITLSDTIVSNNGDAITVAATDGSTAYAGNALIDASAVTDTAVLTLTGGSSTDTIKAGAGATEIDAVSNSPLTDAFADVVCKRNSLAYEISDLASMTGFGGGDIDPFRIADSIAASYDALFAKLTGATVGGFGTVKGTTNTDLDVGKFLLAIQELEKASILLAIKKLRRSPEKHVRWVYGAVSFCFAVRR